MIEVQGHVTRFNAAKRILQQSFQAPFISSMMEG
jgi:hypothetical protein